MPNDNQPAKSYIETVMARADGATKGPWKALRIGDPELGPLIVVAPTESTSYGLTLFKEAHQEQNYAQVCADFLFASEARQDIETLAKIALRAIEALKEVLPWIERETPPQYVGVDREGLPVEYEPTAAEEACGMAAMVLGAALAEINALAAKGSQ